ncbi:hypothetical protein PTSG_05476 [Salpingoeca rosetta]|uniref:Uncharacterized protein n=1 Tax=Salpingoeca rosetta (strain ATCC 50818 / BSB-021) TaxID=946362 RepID=F2UBB6_SALR5|nr:uncharacterized protein PTSG_05476 [Salpingoeca rosetta]EGD73782.1 hypothetical protein PTSG_05476 [Salpingoeca rosetta]|eukprot:XP_004993345.1 hypothetical protein PTSG_05476 [Salpingoeca rosetta]
MPQGPRYHQVPSSEADASHERTQEVPLVADDEPLPSYEAAAGQTTNTSSSAPTAVFVLPSYEEVQEMKRQANEERSTSTAPAQAVVEADHYLGTDASFILSFLVAFLLNGIGFLCAFLMSSTIAGRYGATSGFGLALVKVSVIFYHVYVASVGGDTDDDNDSMFLFGIYRPPSTASPAPNATAISSDGSVTAVFYDDPAYNDGHSPRAHMWISCLFFFFGVMLFFHGIIGYVRAKAAVRRARAAL